MLAYSTVSQIGYMFLAVGLGPAGYVAGLAHLLAHGFFKAGLFLGAGSVMHAMDDQVDMRRFGGLWKKLPITFATFGLGYLALIGFPFLSGFYTKDAIIEAALDRDDAWGWVLGGIAVLGAGLTAFYMTRLMLMTFFGRARWEDGVHPHESPDGDDRADGRARRRLGVLRLPAGKVFPLADWLEPVFGEPEEAEHVVAPLVVGLVVTGVMLLGVLAAWLFVGRREVPVTAPGAGLAGHPGRPQRPLRRRGQRVAVHAPGPVAHPGAGLGGQPRGRRRGQRPGRRRSAARRRGWAARRPGSCAPTPSACSAAPCWSPGRCWR